jgi:(1->4)-alpha-D-glucan 1-alpha-D-glucosylmutase
LTDLIHEDEFPLGREVWSDTQIALPEDAPSRWKEAITGEEAISDGAVMIGDILKRFPVALLLGGEESFIANEKSDARTIP